MASLAGDGDRFNFTVRFSMFGAFWLAFLIATLSQFAINDGNYYEAVNAAQNLLGGWRRWRRYHTCLVLAGCGTLADWTNCNMPPSPAGLEPTRSATPSS